MIIYCDICNGILEHSHLYTLWKPGYRWPVKRYSNSFGKEYSGICWENDKFPCLWFETYDTARRFKKYDEKIRRKLSLKKPHQVGIFYKSDHQIQSVQV